MIFIGFLSLDRTQDEVLRGRGVLHEIGSWIGTIEYPKPAVGQKRQSQSEQA